LRGVADVEIMRIWWLTQCPIADITVFQNEDVANAVAVAGQQKFYR
jgi:hypothetical protein